MHKFKIGDICRVKNPEACDIFQNRASEDNADRIKITDFFNDGYRYDILSGSKKVGDDFACFEDKDLELFDVQTENSLKTLEVFDLMKEAFEGMKDLKSSRELSLAQTELEAAIMWFNKYRTIQGEFEPTATFVQK